MSKQIAQNPSRISFNPKAVDVDALDEIADDRDVSRAELIRETLADLIDQEADDGHDHGELHKPDNEELRDAYEALLALSNHPLGPRPVTVDEAKGRLYSQSCPKASVKRRLLKPLADLGFLTVRGGRIVVHRRIVEDVETAEIAADAEFAQLDEASHEGQRPVGKQIDPTHQELLKYQRAGLNAPFECVAWAASQTLWSNGRGASV